MFSRTNFNVTRLTRSLLVRSFAKKSQSQSPTIVLPTLQSTFPGFSPATRNPLLSPLWSPFAPIANSILGSRFTDEFENLLPFTVDQDVALDIAESPNTYHMQLDVPGVKKEDIHVDLKGRVLTVSLDRKGVKASELGEEDTRYRKVERFRGHVTRSVELPEEVEPAGIHATLMDGVLSIKVPISPL